MQLAAIDAERSLFTTRAVPRRRKIGFVVEVRTVAGGDAAADRAARVEGPRGAAQMLSGLAVAFAIAIRACAQKP